MDKYWEERQRIAEYQRVGEALTQRGRIEEATEYLTIAQEFRTSLERHIRLDATPRDI